jgi:cyclic beta-1,2-glucan synthetase
MWHSPLYFSALGIFSIALISVFVLLGLNGASFEVQLLFALLLVLPSSQLSLELVNYIVFRLLPPRTLPKMDFRKAGIPDAYRTLVVVPTMLVDIAATQEEVEKLEIRFLANKENNLLFGLFSDYMDADQIHTETDAVLLATARTCITALNTRYGGNRFFLFHRERQWSPSEQKFIGWERKRGKLEELNGLIVGTRPRDAAPLLQVGTLDQLTGVKFVITLDSDTQLPNGTARRMIETLSHPLNHARLDKDGRIVSGYTIIQPRVSPSLPSMSGSPFSKLFSDPIGIDPYTSAVSDVNQDLAGEGSYHGKGIYDVRTFAKCSRADFPKSGSSAMICLRAHTCVWAWQVISNSMMNSPRII